jgi:hypothetical protein
MRGNKGGKTMYYNQLLIHAVRMKTTCSIVKIERGKKCFSEHLPTLFKNANTLMYPNQAADALISIFYH